MKNIILFKPIILRKSLDDMTANQKKTALDFLHNRKILAIMKSGLTILEISKETQYPAHFFYGSEAVSIYRQSLGLPDVSIRSIDVNGILNGVPDFDACYDILFLLHRVGIRNCRIRHLHDLGAPMIILFNEYRILQEYVEALEDNHWSGHPVMNCFEAVNGDGEPEHHEEARKSLNDIGISLLSMMDTDSLDEDEKSSPYEAEKELLKNVFGEDI